jgi:hypothetical protein
MARVLVLGYGNPLRSDDGLGWRVAVELFRANASPDVLVLPCHQLTPDLAETASLVETVIFLDCSHKGEPGKILCEEVRSQSGPRRLRMISHLRPCWLWQRNCLACVRGPTCLQFVASASIPAKVFRPR